MPDSMNFSGEQTRNFVKPLHSISVATGSLIVINKATHETQVVKAGESVDLGDTPGLAVYSPWSAAAEVVYTTETEVSPALNDAPDSQQRNEAGEVTQTNDDIDLHPPVTEETVRGDEHPEDDRETGPYESRPKGSLFELAQERGLHVTTSMKKDELIAVLRGES